MLSERDMVLTTIYKSFISIFRRVHGLIFGISECLSSIKSGDCSSIIIESAVNPRMIVQPILEACINEVPVVCMENLRKTCSSNFGISTTCLGVKKDCLTEISNKVKELAKGKIPKAPAKQTKVEDVEMSNSKAESPMEIQESSQSPYLYRTNQTTRVFVPPSEGDVKIPKLKLIGQDFIRTNKAVEPNKASDKKAYKKMIVKRISNNPNRVKLN